jgi:hypothetical protein
MTVLLIEGSRRSVAITAELGAGRGHGGRVDRGRQRRNGDDGEQRDSSDELPHEIRVLVYRPLHIQYDRQVSAVGKLHLPPTQQTRESALHSLSHAKVIERSPWPVEIWPRLFRE